MKKIQPKPDKTPMWHYPEPTECFASLKNWVVFHPYKIDVCYLQVEAQEGDFMVAGSPGIW